MEALQSFLTNSKDANSVYNQVFDSCSYKKDLVWDIAGYMFGGFETSTKTNASLLYYLSIHPEVKEKLLKELDRHILI
jgi:cytochrome P450